MWIRWVFISSFLSCPVVWEISIQIGPGIALEILGCLILWVVNFLISILLAYSGHNGCLWHVQLATVSSRKNESRISLDGTPHQTEFWQIHFHICMNVKILMGPVNSKSSSLYLKDGLSDQVLMAMNFIFLLTFLRNVLWQFCTEDHLSDI
jgi:hypothetical protein